MIDMSVSSFVISAIDHALNNAKTPLHIVNLRFEEWKKGRIDVRIEEQTADENYIIQYANKRSQYEEAYKQWYTTRKDILEQSKKTNVIGDQEKLIKELIMTRLPEELLNPIPDMYTKYKANK